MSHPRAHSANRVPITHPDYRYPGSRNPYSARILDEFTRSAGGTPDAGLIYSDNETERHRGRWRERFALSSSAGGSPHLADAPELEVEIGCNAGHVVTEWALANPRRAYIGLDWKFKPIYRAAEKARKRGLGNILFFRAHAERLAYMFDEGEIDRLLLFFPDPWPRKSQWKNRFVRPERLLDLWSVLRPGGLLHIKTDHPGYFAWMEDALAEIPGRFEVIERSTDLHAGNPRAGELNMPDVTLFERIFIREGIAIKSLLLRAVKSG